MSLALRHLPAARPARRTLAALAAALLAACATPQPMQSVGGQVQQIKLPPPENGWLYASGRTALNAPERASVFVTGLEGAPLRTLAAERLAAHGMTLASDAEHAAVRIDLRAAVGTRNSWGQYCGVPAGEFLAGSDAAVLRYCDPKGQQASASTLEPARAKLFESLAGNSMLGAVLSISADELAGRLRSSPYQQLPEDATLAAAMSIVRLRAGSALLVAQLAPANAPAGSTGFGALRVDTWTDKRETLTPDNARHILERAFDALGAALAGSLAPGASMSAR